MAKKIARRLQPNLLMIGIRTITILSINFVVVYSHLNRYIFTGIFCRILVLNIKYPKMKRFM